MTDVRTTLNWLAEHELADEAEVWLLADNAVYPVTGVDVDENVTIITGSVWDEGALTYEAVLGKILDNYSAGGSVIWQGHENYTYRGSYVKNRHTAVFLTFLPRETQIVDSHEEKMEQRREQAKQLTQEIQNSWDIST